MRSFIDACLRLLFPPKCAACRTLLGREERVLCTSCAEAYQDAVSRACPRCLLPLNQCVCPNCFLERHGVREVVKLFAYQAHRAELPTNQLIFRLKRCDADAVIRFLAHEMSASLRPHLASDVDYVLVGAPRSSAAIRRYGEDHVRLLCRALSRALGIPYVRAIDRVGNAGPQKKKNIRERMESARISYRPRRGADLRGKTVILVDDVVTSGATLAACATCVRRCGARAVMACVVGAAYRYQDLVGMKLYYREREKYRPIRGRY